MDYQPGRVLMSRGETVSRRCASVYMTPLCFQLCVTCTSSRCVGLCRTTNPLTASTMASAIRQISRACRSPLRSGRPDTTMYASPIVSTCIHSTYHIQKEVYFQHFYNSLINVTYLPYKRHRSRWSCRRCCRDRWAGRRPAWAWRRRTAPWSPRCRWSTPSHTHTTPAGPLHQPLAVALLAYI